jgi:hypothetical protein
MLTHIPSAHLPPWLQPLPEQTCPRKTCKPPNGAISLGPPSLLGGVRAVASKMPLLSAVVTSPGTTAGPENWKLLSQEVELIETKEAEANRLL